MHRGMWQYLMPWEGYWTEDTMTPWSVTCWCLMTWCENVLVNQMNGGESWKIILVFFSGVGGDEQLFNNNDRCWVFLAGLSWAATNSLKEKSLKEASVLTLIYWFWKHYSSTSPSRKPRDSHGITFRLPQKALCCLVLYSFHSKVTHTTV